jgi:nucleolar pre-ribosomal-associated protein 1
MFIFLLPLSKSLLDFWYLSVLQNLIFFDLYMLFRSFYQPKRDHSLDLTGIQNIEEYHACQNLLVMVANVLGGKKIGSPACLSPLDAEISALIQWERSLLRN